MRQQFERKRPSAKDSVPVMIRQKTILEGDDDIEFIVINPYGYIGFCLEINDLKHESVDALFRFVNGKTRVDLFFARSEEGESNKRRNFAQLFLWAVDNGRADVIKAILTSPDQEIRQSVFFSCIDTQAVKRIVADQIRQEKSKITLTTAERTKARDKAFKDVFAIHKTSSCDYAMQFGSPSVVDMMLDRPNPKFWSTLAKNSSKDTLIIEIRKIIASSQVTSGTKDRDAEAIAKAEVEKISKLLIAGAPVNGLGNSEFNPEVINAVGILLSSQLDNRVKVPLLKLLASFGADLNQFNTSNESAFDFVMQDENPSPDVVYTLLQYGCSLSSYLNADPEVRKKLKGSFVTMGEKGLKARTVLSLAEYFFEELQKFIVNSKAGDNFAKRFDAWFGAMSVKFSQEQDRLGLSEERGNSLWGELSFDAIMQSVLNSSFTMPGRQLFFSKDKTYASLADFAMQKGDRDLLSRVLIYTRFDNEGLYYVDDQSGSTKQDESLQKKIAKKGDAGMAESVTAMVGNLRAKNKKAGRYGTDIASLALSRKLDSRSSVYDSEFGPGEYEEVPDREGKDGKEEKDGKEGKAIVSRPVKVVKDRDYYKGHRDSLSGIVEALEKDNLESKARTAFDPIEMQIREILIYQIGPELVLYNLSKMTPASPLLSALALLSNENGDGLLQRRRDDIKKGEVGVAARIFSQQTIDNMLKSIEVIFEEIGNHFGFFPPELEVDKKKPASKAKPKGSSALAPSSQQSSLLDN